MSSAGPHRERLCTEGFEPASRWLKARTYGQGSQEAQLAVRSCQPQWASPCQPTVCRVAHRPSSSWTAWVTRPVFNTCVSLSVLAKLFFSSWVCCFCHHLKFYSSKGYTKASFLWVLFSYKKQGMVLNKNELGEMLCVSYFLSVYLGIPVT